MPPLEAPEGTVAVTRASLTTVKAADTPPPNFTEVAPVSAAPLIVTVEPTRPEVGEIDVILGAATTAVTVKLDALDALPAEVVTAIGPLVAPEGTVAVICVSETTVKVDALPLNVTDDAPVKPVPVTVTDVPGEPLAGEKPPTVGAA